MAKAKPKIQCTRTGCVNTATVKPVLILRAPDPLPQVPAEGVINLPTCATCAELLGPEDIITDEGWKLIQRNFYERGKAMPDRAKTELAWKDL